MLRSKTRCYAAPLVLPSRFDSRILLELTGQSYAALVHPGALVNPTLHSRNLSRTTPAPAFHLRAQLWAARQTFKSGLDLTVWLGTALPS